MDTRVLVPLALLPPCNSHWLTPTAVHDAGAEIATAAKERCMAAAPITTTLGVAEITCTKEPTKLPVVTVAIAIVVTVAIAIGHGRRCCTRQASRQAGRQAGVQSAGQEGKNAGPRAIWHAKNQA